jgi:Protein of unknown function (DUF2568)
VTCWTRSWPSLAALRAANLALKFLLELGALAAFAYWGSRTGPTAVNILLGVGAPLAMAVVWGTWAAPRAARRLERAPRVILELSVFALAALALIAADAPLVAAAFGAAVVLNAALLTAFDQWEG